MIRPIGLLKPLSKGSTKIIEACSDMIEQQKQAICYSDEQICRIQSITDIENINNMCTASKNCNNTTDKIATSMQGKVYLDCSNNKIVKEYDLKKLIQTRGKTVAEQWYKDIKDIIKSINTTENKILETHLVRDIQITICDPCDISGNNVGVNNEKPEVSVLPKHRRIDIIEPKKNGEELLKCIHDITPVQLYNITITIIMIIHSLSDINLYHNDCHLGNILFNKETNEIYLIDYGSMTKNLPLDQNNNTQSNIKIPILDIIVFLNRILQSTMSNDKFNDVRIKISTMNNIIKSCYEMIEVEIRGSIEIKVNLDKLEESYKNLINLCRAEYYISKLPISKQYKYLKYKNKYLKYKNKYLKLKNLFKE
jgi:hypothetical protein